MLLLLILMLILLLWLRLLLLLLLLTLRHQTGMSPNTKEIVSSGYRTVMITVVAVGGGSGDVVFFDSSAVCLTRYLPPARFLAWKLNERVSSSYYLFLSLSPPPPFAVYHSVCLSLSHTCVLSLYHSVCLSVSHTYIRCTYSERRPLVTQGTQGEEDERVQEMTLRVVAGEHVTHSRRIGIRVATDCLLLQEVLIFFCVVVYSIKTSTYKSTSLFL